MSSLPAPLNVSPLIRFGRYSLLGAGIMYGAYHQNRLSKKAAAIREVEAKQKVIRDAELAVIKKRNAEEEIRQIALLSKSS